MDAGEGPVVDELLPHGELVEAGYVRADALADLIQADRSGRTDRAKEIWHLLTLEEWMRQLRSARSARVGAR